MGYTGDKITAVTYLILVPDIYQWSSTTEPYVRGIRVDRARAQKPRLNKGEIAVKVKLNFDKQQLIDAIPVVSVDVNDFRNGPSEPELSVVGD